MNYLELIEFHYKAATYSAIKKLSFKVACRVELFQLANLVLKGVQLILEFSQVGKNLAKKWE
jgi:hypothetical protein